VGHCNDVFGALPWSRCWTECPSQESSHYTVGKTTEYINGHDSVGSMWRDLITQIAPQRAAMYAAANHWPTFDKKSRVAIGHDVAALYEPLVF
jgi:hypothetical protein